MPENTFTLCQLVRGSAPEYPTFLVEGRNAINAQFAFIVHMDFANDDGKGTRETIITPEEPSGDFFREFCEWVWKQPAYKKAMRRYTGYQPE